MRLVQISLAAALLIGACLCQPAVTLRNGEIVESLYYHESWMPEELMVEMWIDFTTRRLRLKCSPHDALGWNSRRFDSWRLDVVLSRLEFCRIANGILRAGIESWERDASEYSASTLDTRTCYVRMMTANGAVERFVAVTEPDGFRHLKEVVHFAVSHEKCRYEKGERDIDAFTSPEYYGTITPIAHTRHECNRSHFED